MLLVEDSKVSRKPLQLGRTWTYHRRRTLRKTKIAGKATETTGAGKYVIRETVSIQLHHSAVQTCHHGPTNWSIIPRHDMF